MVSNISAMPHCARLQLTAVTLKSGQYEVLTEGLHWRLRATKQFSKRKNQKEHFNAVEARPCFVVPAGVYDLTLEHTALGTREVHRIVLQENTLTDEIVYLGSVDIDDSEENYHLNNDDDFNVDREHARRGQDREGQRKFGAAAEDLRQPEIVGPEAGFGEAQQVAQQSGMQSHPLLSNSAQFDGVAAKMNPNLTENVHAAEAQVEPSLQPGAKAQQQPSTAPTMQRR
jgi:hypothetical protein